MMEEGLEIVSDVTAEISEVKAHSPPPHFLFLRLVTNCLAQHSERTKDDGHVGSSACS